VSGELCVADAGRQNARRGSSLQQLSLRKTPDVRLLFCVILSEAKDLDGRSDDRRQQRTASTWAVPLAQFTKAALGV
jgi:hypothetical protein